MLDRELPYSRDCVDDEVVEKLDATLSSFFPQEWKDKVLGPGNQHDRIMPFGIGEHTFFCNPVVPDKSLLADGTDKIHQPCDTYVRRMWAGGALRVGIDHFFGWGGRSVRKRILCYERIKDVQLRGQGEAQKIFVTIRRKIARYHLVVNAIQTANAEKKGFPITDADMERLVWEKMRDWPQNMMIEDRNLVFFREQPPEVIKDIKAGKLPSVKYLPGVYPSSVT